MFFNRSLCVLLWCNPKSCSLILFYSCFFSVILFGWWLSLFLYMCASFIPKIKVNWSVGRVSSRLRNSRLQSRAKSFLSILWDCYNNCTVPYLFQFFYSQVISLFMQAYYSNIPSLKLELPVTYNYAYDLSIQIILNQTKLIKNKLR